ncbi:NYN domain-containing protein [Patescibacteria group bacterium]|nr:NYN domain-containing protein [Patescibacteria group bacterium]
MNQQDIKTFINKLEKTQNRNIVIIDYGNVQKWERSIKWRIGLKELGNLVKHMSKGSRFLRRFYYGKDYGDNKSETLTEWSRMVLEKSKMSGFENISKRVKYIRDKNYKTGFVKKCDMDLMMGLDLIKEKDNYDYIILFSGDGDLAAALKFMFENYGKKVVCLVQETI